MGDGGRKGPLVLRGKKAGGRKERRKTELDPPHGASSLFLDLPSGLFLVPLDY